MKYFITNAPLTILEEAERINWAGFGFDVKQVSQAMRAGFQQQDGDRMVSILPIADEEILRQRLGGKIGSEDEDGYYHIIAEAEATAERDRLKAVNDTNAAEKAKVPTDDDIFKAQQLKLLTEINIKLGGMANV